MNHILKRNGRYYYNRRVPDLVRQFHQAANVRIALGTDSKDQAIQKAANLNAQIEQYWKSLLIENKEYSENEFTTLVKIAKLFEFRFIPSTKVAGLDLEEILSRIQTLKSNPHSEIHAKALLGTETKCDSINVSQALERFWVLAKDRSINKSKSQLRKWVNPRKKAINNFIEVIGDLPLTKLTRDDILQFRDWWIDRVDNGLNEGTANKDFIHLKNIIETVSENDRLEVDTEYLFRKINLKERFSQSRKPLDSRFIRDVLLIENNLEGLTKEEKWFLYAMADTGARIAELTGLEPEDIHLNAPVPYISIKDRKNRPLKTPHSARRIPLVGYALSAFQNCPKGFASYQDNSDMLSTRLNKYLRANNLLPTEQHSVYSLRHSFQDRLLSVNAPDRVQAELMGHKFKRPRYGDGSTLEHKREWLERACVEAIG